MKTFILSMAAVATFCLASVSAQADDRGDHNWNDGYWHKNHEGYWHGHRGHWEYHHHHHVFVHVGPVTIAH